MPISNSKLYNRKDLLIAGRADNRVISQRAGVIRFHAASATNLDTKSCQPRG
jgi:hypothetical protein